MSRARLQLKKSLGFTLIEVLVVVGILGVLVTLVLVAVNPARQLMQTRDTQRSSDLKAVQTALEAYRVASNIYPLSTVNNEITDAPWGGSWDGYLSTVPKDPLESRSYSYVSTDGTSYQLYADFEGDPPDTLACGAGCGPNGTYDGGVASSNSSLQTFTPEPTPLPTATPVPLPGGKVTYFGSSSSYPKIIQVDFDPLDVASGSQQILTLKVWSTSPVSSVSVNYQLDNGTTQTYQLDQTSAVLSGGIYKDVWAKTIPFSDTINNTYILNMFVTDGTGDYSWDLIIRD